jgi:hypothetical protein
LELRNGLIHGGLVNFDWDSRDECDRLVAELTDMNEVIGLQIDFVAAVVRSIRPENAAFEESTRDDERVFLARLGDDS